VARASAATDPPVLSATASLPKLQAYNACQRSHQTLVRHQAPPSAPPNARSCVHDPVSDSVAHKSRKRREIELAHDG
jgi:hypothetical protein